MNESPLALVDEVTLRRLSHLAGGLRAPGGIRAVEGTRQASSAGTGLEFREFRPYQAGDDIRRVDWRASMRGERRYVRMYENESTATWYVCLDASASMSQPDRRRWQLANQIAAAFAYILLDGGNRVGLVVASDEILEYLPGAASRQQYIRIVDSLIRCAARRTQGRTRLAAAARLAAGAHVVVVSDFLQADAMTSDLHRLQRPGRQLRAIRIRSPDDTDGREHGVCDFIDVESHERITVRASDRDTAALRLARLEGQLRDYCSRTGIRMSFCESTDSWPVALLDHVRGHHG